MKIYLDNCCYNRPFDDQSQQRICDETNAITSIINRAKINGDIILSSDVLLFEIGEIQDSEKKAKIFSTLNKSAREKVSMNSKIFQRANEIVKVSNVKEMDALHISSAEFGNADIFLTTGDKLIRACKNLDLNVRVLNPVYYLEEAIKNDEY